MSAPTPPSGAGCQDDLQVLPMQGPLLPSAFMGPLHSGPLLRSVLSPYCAVIVRRDREPAHLEQPGAPVSDLGVASEQDLSLSHLH